MKLLATLGLLLSITNISQAKLLDKIVAVIDDTIVTKSMIVRVSKNYRGRKEISPFIYTMKKPTHPFLIDTILNALLIRDKLKELGYTIPDTFVESNIKSNEERLGLTRKKLLAFLKDNNLTYDEYFELTKQTIEFQHFNSKVIQPVISITDQEIKNSFFKKNINNKTLSFRYNIVDFHISTTAISKKQLPKLKVALIDMQKGASLPSQFSDIQSSPLGDIFEDGLTPVLKKALKYTDQGAFSNPVSISGSYHLFFVKSKDLVESEQFIEAKEHIRAQLFEEKAKRLTKLWFEREKNKHYIKYFH